MQGAQPVAALVATLTGLTRGTVVTMCTPERSPVSVWAQQNGFAVVDHDTFCATSHADIPDDLHCLDPGLA